MVVTNDNVSFYIVILIIPFSTLMSPMKYFGYNLHVNELKCFALYSIVGDV